MVNSSNSVLSALSLLLAFTALPALAATQSYQFGERKIVVTDTVDGRTPQLLIQASPSYFLKLSLDCRTPWDALASAHSLDWNTYAAIAPELDAFFARNRDRLEALSNDTACAAADAHAISDVVRAGSFKEMLADIHSGPDDVVIARVRAQWLAGKLPATIPRTTQAPGAILKHALIVTHTSYSFGGNSAIKPALDRVIREFKTAGRPVIYLLNDDHVADAAWMTEDRAPDLALPSRSGEHALIIRTAEITSVGGFRELCEAETVTRAAESFFKSGGTGVFTVNFPMGATYSEKMAYRLPGEENTALPALLNLDHYPSLQEAYDLLGEQTFVATLGPSAYLDADRYRVRLFLDGRPVGAVGQGTHVVDFKYWTTR